MIGLVDCNNFYASCERVFRPDWEGRPVAVLSNNDGCVIARSNEAKELVEMEAPAFKIPPDARRQLILVSSNYTLYGDMSRRVTATLRDYTPDVEIYSIDESFLGFDGFPIDGLIDHCIETDDHGEPKKNIMTSRSFGRLTSDPHQVRQAVMAHAGRGAEKLRAQGSVARAIQVHLKTNKHREDLPQYHPALIVQLPTPLTIRA